MKSDVRAPIFSGLFDDVRVFSRLGIERTTADADRQQNQWSESLCFEASVRSRVYPFNEPEHQMEPVRPSLLNENICLIAQFSEMVLKLTWKIECLELRILVIGGYYSVASGKFVCWIYPRTLCNFHSQRFFSVRRGPPLRASDLTRIDRGRCFVSPFPSNSRRDQWRRVAGRMIIQIEKRSSFWVWQRYESHFATTLQSREYLRGNFVNQSKRRPLGMPIVQKFVVGTQVK